jgi:putative ABC transport system permease protein
MEFKQAYVKFPYYDHKQEKIRPDGYASSLNGDLTTSFTDIFMSFSGVNYFDNNAVHLRSLCGYKALIVNDDEGEFSSAQFKKLPREISIYPKSFEAKDSITSYLDRWNSDEVLTLNGTKYTRAERDDLSYTDTISLIVAVIDTFINAVTIALIVFTSLSLVVSCFMIAVITYISVVERIKEIGVIRSLGGRKGDVASLFIMETLMTGLFSGVFGITMTYILQIIVNVILVAQFGIAIMNLTVWTALLMIGISIALSVLSGLIPSQSAAHKDPVVALRSNE